MGVTQDGRIHTLRDDAVRTSQERLRPRRRPAAGESGGVSSIAAAFKINDQQWISLTELMTRIRSSGIEPNDPRVREMIASLPDTDGNEGGGLTIEQFTAVCDACRR
jgi:EF-hand domain